MENKLMGAIMLGSIVVCLGFSRSGQAAEPLELTLGQAVELALTQNRQLIAIRKEVGVARGGLVQARTYPYNPDVVVGGDYGAGTSRGGEDLTRTLYGVSVGISQVLELHGQRGIRAEIAEANLASADWTVRDAERTMTAAVVKSFSDVLLAQERVEVAQQIVALMRELRDVSQKLFDAGAVPQLDVLQADVALGRAVNQQTVAETALTAARKELNLLIGQRPESEVRAAGPLSLSPPQGELSMLLNQARTNRPDLKAAHAGLRKAEEALKLVRAEQVLPTVRLSATFDHAQDFDSRNNLGLVSLSIPLPLFNQRQGDLKAALAEREKRQAEIDRIEAGIEKEVSAAYQVAVSSQKIVEQYVDHILPAQEENLRLLRRGYQQGEFRLTDVLVGQRDFIDVRVAYLDAVAALNGAVTDLYRAVGARP